MLRFRVTNATDWPQTGHRLAIERPQIGRCSFGITGRVGGGRMGREQTESENMMAASVRIEFPDRPAINLEPEASRTLLEVMAAAGTAGVSAPCGGRGRCGKCTVRVAQSADRAIPISASDRRFLTDTQLGEGYRLACTLPSDAAARVVVVRDGATANVKSDVPTFAEKADPIDTPEVRLPDAGAGADAQTGTRVRLAMAVDIGTTTVAVYSTNLTEGRVVAAYSQMNRQSVFGADVLSRISYAETRGLAPLTRAIRGQLRDLIAQACSSEGCDSAHNVRVTVAANTTMLHLLAGVDPAGIGRAPFVPAFVESRDITAAEMGIPAAEGAVVRLLPSIAAYVGADIVAAIIAADMDRTDRTVLLVDIGTNGEIALVHDHTLYACATAAGPAFEGANISCGVGGVVGALSAWRAEEGAFAFDTIAGGEMVGVCGSGLLDIVARLLDDGVVDETGRMLGPDDADDLEGEHRERNASRLVERDGEPAFAVTASYAITQKDVRELQLAKAAIAAGAYTLAHAAGIEIDDVERFVITGGFGSHLRIESARRIGLVPPLPLDRFETIDNGAGHGAVQALLHKDVEERMRRAAEASTYIELSGHAYFQDRYIEEMMFPEDLSL